LSSFLVFVVLFTPVGAVPTSRDLYSKHRWAVVGISNGSPSISPALPVVNTREGTGFFVDEDCTILTAKHVIDGIPPDRLVIRFRLPSRPSDQVIYAATVIYQNRDLAFLRAKTAGSDQCHSVGIGPLPLADDWKSLVHTGDDVLIAGYPVMEKATGAVYDVAVVRDGIVASTELESFYDKGPMLLLDLIGVPGFSGGPVIHRPSGRVVGIITGPGPIGRDAGLEWVTPVDLQDYRKAPRPQPPIPPLDLTPSRQR